MDPWPILDLYFRDHTYPFTKHHLDSFREFIRTQIPNTIQSFNPITMLKMDDSGEESLRVEIYVGGMDGKNIYMERPTILDKDGESMLLTPQEARLRNMTYAGHLYADIDIYYTKGEGDEHKESFPMTFLGSIPLMLHSDQCILHGQGSKILQTFGECPMDPGGYFIVDGKEKVIVSQERITTNRLFISKTDDPNVSFKAMIRCTGDTGETVLAPRTVEFQLIRVPDTLYQSDVKEAMRPYKGAITVTLPALGNIPLTILFRAFGIETDKQIVESILGPLDKAHPAMVDFIRPSIAHGAAVGIYTMTEALEYLKPKSHYNSIAHVKSILTTEIFPNIPDSFTAKGMYLGYLVQKFMLTALGLKPLSDRDSYIFKRVDISGNLLAQLFHQTYSKFRKEVRDSLDRQYHYGPWKNTGAIEKLVRGDNLAKIFPATMVTEIFNRSLKGMWGTVQDDPDQSIVQDLSRISYIGFLSHLRRVNMSLDRSIKIVSPHRLHSQQWGIMCPFESPDGASIGYLKNFALLTQITFGTNPQHMFKALHDLEVVPMDQVSPASLSSMDTVHVFVNGTLYGITYKPHTLVRALRLFRRNALMNPFVSISWNIQDREVRIQTEPGRPCRPLFIVENKNVLYQKVATKKQPSSWFDLVLGSYIDQSERNAARYSMDEYVSPFAIPKFQAMELEEILTYLEGTQAVIEYLDIEEENTRLLAMKEDDLNDFHTHLEIHPSTALSVVTQIVPFANHNQAPRVIFHGAQSKQAIGVYATNWHKRFDTNGYVQHYPQKSIVTTRGSHYNGNNKMPNGCNVIVAVMTHTGFNQEDGIIINKTSVERGLFHITGYKTITASEKTLSPKDRLIFANPVKMREQGKNILGIKRANYTLLNEDGIIREESYIPKGQEAVTIGMVHIRQEVKQNKKGLFAEQVIEETYRDMSQVTDIALYGTVDRVFVANQSATSSQRICKVRLRKIRKPELGNKMCSRHGQKGVVGMILSQENMPYNKDGIVPDLIINPHAFPSRMTIGHLVETVTAKLCCFEGSYADGTVFLPFDANMVYDGMEKLGMERHGNEILYNGRTGQQIETEIFFGPIFYYCLKHMVADKMNARGTGPRVLLTHQPTSGRSKGGGLRIGEMERDVILGHGLSQFTKECMMEKSDKYAWAVCKRCGTLAVFTPSRGLQECTGCKTNDVSIVETPYAFKLLMQELEGMGIQMRLSADAIREMDDELLQTLLVQNSTESQEGGGNSTIPGSDEEDSGDLEETSDEELPEEEEGEEELLEEEGEEKVAEEATEEGEDVDGVGDEADVRGAPQPPEQAGVSMDPVLEEEPTLDAALAEPGVEDEGAPEGGDIRIPTTGGYEDVASDIKVIEIKPSVRYGGDKIAPSSAEEEMDDDFYSEV